MSGLTDKEVVEFYYQGLREKVGDVIANLQIFNVKSDLKAVAAFRKLSAKVNIPDSNKSLIESLTLLFQYYDQLNLNHYNLTLSFLLSDKGSWIFSALLKIHHREVESYRDSGTMREYLDSIYNLEDENLDRLRETVLQKNKRYKEVSGKKE